MNWVRARAYQDGQFLLERLLSQVASDVHEVNRLPVKLRLGWHFKIRRESDAPDRFAVVAEPSQGESASMLFIVSGRRVRVAEQYGIREFMVSAEVGEETMAEVWVDAADPNTSRTLPEMSRYLLEPFFFNP